MKANFSRRTRTLCSRTTWKGRIESAHQFCMRPNGYAMQLMTINVLENASGVEDALRDTANAQAIDVQSEIDGSLGEMVHRMVFQIGCLLWSDNGACPTRPGAKISRAFFLDRNKFSRTIKTSHLNQLLTSDLKTEGVNHRRELNENNSDLMRLIYAISQWISVRSEA